ncbi:MAG TPA: hypothetical protein VFQ25_15530, partial [Ktedonobacterales bacterium]|nr:hypothetical protein [Ktedonobacterales bacterium]
SDSVARVAAGDLAILIPCAVYANLRRSGQKYMPRAPSTPAAPASCGDTRRHEANGARPFFDPRYLLYRR